MVLDEEEFADRIVQAHRSGTLLPAELDHGLTAAAAYRIQSRVTSARWPTPRVGWKLGYTSAAMRRQMGVQEPNFGPLHAGMALPDDALIVGGVTQPRVEPEIAAVLRTAVSSIDELDDDLLDAVVDWFAALEVVDSVWDDYRFDWVLNTADGSSAAYVVLGRPLGVRGADLAGVGVRLWVDGSEVAAGTGGAAMGDPRVALRWLAGQLAGSLAGSRGRGPLLEAGAVVITGGLTAAAPLDPGADVRAQIGSATVRLRRG